MLAPVRAATRQRRVNGIHHTARGQQHRSLANAAQQCPTQDGDRSTAQNSFTTTGAPGAVRGPREWPTRGFGATEGRGCSTLVKVASTCLLQAMGHSSLHEFGSQSLKDLTVFFGTAGRRRKGRDRTEAGEGQERERKETT